MNSKEKQKVRKEIICELEKLQKKAYSGVTCMEYDAIKTTKHFLNLVYEREEKILDAKEG